ncbi:P-loop containing nucleoside triphosphate hydrolase protein [Coprinopsis sp. MPI-PUGE-AT-0042]|nr:P-loop containing nucleoside triphosphate hydrolase protein [Coprinopsis sp. MPI-PUGE-AT-0042]
MSVPRPTSNSTSGSTPSLDEIRRRTQDKWKIRPCLWQLEVTQAILARNSDIVSVAGTGMGKTLTFWMPLLFSRPDALQIIITPLNLLGQQQVSILEKLGLTGIFISSETATDGNWHDIHAAKYQVLVINPECLMKPGGGFEKLARDPLFQRRIISLTFDEGHCICTWSSFREDYKNVGALSYMLSMDIPRVITSATLTEATLDEIKKTLNLRSDKLKTFQCSNDRPNIHLTVRKILSPLNTFNDLQVVLQGYVANISRPHHTFLVFFDDITQSISAHSALTKEMSKEDKGKILWFNADMTGVFKTDTIRQLLSGEVWGLLTTDSFGMGLDMPHIDLVIQWRATCSLTTLWQRFGRAGRDRAIEGTGMFLVEKEHFDDEKEHKQKKRIAKQRKKGKARRVRPRLDPVIQGGTFVFENPGDLSSESSDSEESADELPVVALAPKQTRGTKKANHREIDKDLDEVINAKQRKMACIRLPVSKTFKNDKAGGYRFYGIYDRCHLCSHE